MTFMRSTGSAIIEMGAWLASPAGAYALDWAQQQVDRAVADAFGYHALQLGLPQLDGLRANRMPHRWVAHDSMGEPTPIQMPQPSDASITTLALDDPVALHCSFDALPFPAASIDLVLMPHTLELAADPHATLAEVERVMVPDGRLVLLGFNPMSLWGLRQRSGLGWRLGRVDGDPAAQGYAADYLGYRRVRDWLRLLSFEIDAGRFGLWRPPLSTERALQRMAWMDRMGAHWWPVLGGAYAIEAIKRVRGMRLVGLSPARQNRAAAAPAVVTQRQGAGACATPSRPPPAASARHFHD
jgi:SAM-dependent methyltransferase